MACDNLDGHDVAGGGAGGPIFFVGAGPGDPELVTVKGRRLLEAADLVLYAGSLVPKALLGWVRPGVPCHDSSGMHLEQQIELMAAAWRRGEAVVRLHTGDPAIFGAIGEQMAALAALNIPFEVVPGVSSFLAAAAALPAELTIPGVSQTVIICRCPGRTPVPEGQDLAELAAHRATMAIFLSAGLLADTVSRLAVHYPPDTPVALVWRASWPDQEVVRADLGTIVQAMAGRGIDGTAMILVGEALTNDGEPSKLYDKNFSHRCRGNE